MDTKIEISQCRLCCRPVNAPHRRADKDGRIVEGCVDSDHDGHLYGVSLEWHNRPVAKAMRKDWKKFIAAATR